MDRSIELVIVLLGILKAGAAYLPVDPEWPSKRKELVCKDAKVNLIITDKKNASFKKRRALVFKEYHSDLTEIAIKNFNKDYKLPGPSIKDLAYVIYTSGTTGCPKGVMIEHHGLSNRLFWMQEIFKANSDDRTLQKTNYTFDVSIWEFFWPIMFGSSLVIASPGSHIDPKSIADQIIYNKVSIIHFVPSMLGAFLEVVDQNIFKFLRFVIVSGESLSSELMSHFYKAVGENNTILYNLYGPTEASIDVTFWRCPLDFNIKKVLIGKPIANTKIYILDKYNRIIPPGIIGEVCISGVCLSRGYLGNKALTDEKFLSDVPIEGERIYKTGDLGAYTFDGFIEYIGRKDHQVKVRGYRIELQEIELAICSHPGIANCIVIASLIEISAHYRLLAFYIEKHNIQCKPDDIRIHLEKLLPKYMIPTKFVSCQQFPITKHGKIDRKKLEIMANNSKNDEVIAVQDRNVLTEIEKTLCEVYAELLCLDIVQINDNFFEIGGDSIIAIRLSAKLQELSYDIEPRLFFTYQTIRELAEYISKLKKDYKSIPTQLIPTQALALPAQTWLLSQEVKFVSRMVQQVQLSIENNISSEIIEKAIKCLVETHHSLRVKFSSNQNSFIQTLNKAPEVILSIEDLRNLSKEKIIQKKYFLSKKRRTLKIHKEGLFKADLILLDGTHSELWLTIHHLAVDMNSWQIIGTDLASALQQIMRDKEPVLPYTLSPLVWSSVLSESVKKYRTNDYYWRKFLEKKHEIKYRQYNNKHNSYYFQIELPKSELYAKDIEAAIVTAFLITNKKVFNNHEFGITLESHGRHSLDDNQPVRTVGWLTNLYPIILNSSLYSTVLDAFYYVKEEINISVDDIRSFGVLNFYPGYKNDNLQITLPRVCINFLGKTSEIFNKSNLFSVILDSKERLVRYQKNLYFDIEITAWIVEQELKVEIFSSEKKLKEKLFKKNIYTVLHSICSLSNNTTSRSQFVGYEDSYKLTFMQEAMLAHWLFNRQSNVSFEQLSIHISGELDPNLLKMAWHQLSAQEGILRTIFVLQGNNNVPEQRVLKQIEPKYSFYDFSNTRREKNAWEQKEKLFLIEDRKNGFDLLQGPLARLAMLKFSKDKFIVVLSFHHIILDGWSLSLLIDELLDIYARLLNVRSLRKKILLPFSSFINYSYSQEDSLTQISKWKAFLSGFKKPIMLLSEQNSTSEADIDVQTKTITKSVYKKALVYARSNHIPLSNILFSAWAILLAKLSGNRDIIFGITVSGRDVNLAGIDKMLGMFINILPIRICIDNKSTFESIINKISDISIFMIQNRHVTLSDLQKFTQVPLNQPLFDTLVIFQNYPSPKTEKAALNFKINEIKLYEKSAFGLTLVIDVSSDLKLELRYYKNKFNNTYINSLLKELINIINLIIKNPKDSLLKILLNKFTPRDPSELLPTDMQKNMNKLNYSVKSLNSELVFEVISILSDTLNYSDIKADTRLIDIGLTSLTLVEIHNNLQKKLGCKIPLIDMLGCATPKAIAEHIEKIIDSKKQDLIQ